MKQPEALHLANAHEQVAKGFDFPELALQTAAELRRLHEANQAMLEALKEIAEMYPSEMSASKAARAAIAKATGETE
jgi:ABC-type nitrate/sulfonate/bicarbonate transport system ATPase subunit